MIILGSLESAQWTFYQCLLNFFCQVWSYERISVQNRRFCSNGVRLTQHFTYRVAPTNHSSSLKTRLNDLSHGIKIRTDLSFVLSQCRQTERRTDTFLIVRAGISCSAEKRFIVLREKVYNAPSPIRVLKYGSDQVRLKYSVGLEFHIAVHIFF